MILNLTPVVRNNWKVYTHGKKAWKEVFNSDEKKYWGTGDVLNPEIVVNSAENDMYEVTVHLPALGALVLK